MSKDNIIHRISFKRKRHIVYGQKYSFDMIVISFDTDQQTLDKTHEIIKL